MTISYGDTFIRKTLQTEEEVADFNREMELDSLRSSSPEEQTSQNECPHCQAWSHMDCILAERERCAKIAEAMGCDIQMRPQPRCFPPMASPSSVGIEISAKIREGK